MLLYHGSITEVSNPSLEKSIARRDFGKGFYLTSDQKLAKEWAIKKKNKLSSSKAIVNKYEFPDEKINKLQVLKFKKADKDWFTFVAYNRTNDRIENIKHDIVIGPVVNDGTFQVIDLYFQKIIDIESAIEALKTQKLNDQFVIKTEKALSYLEFKGSEEV